MHRYCVSKHFSSLPKHISSGSFVLGSNLPIYCMTTLHNAHVLGTKFDFTKIRCNGRTSCRSFTHSSHLSELMIRHKLTSPASEKPCSPSKALMKVDSIISAMDISDVPVKIFLICLLCTSQDIFDLTTNLQQDHRCDNK